MTTVQKTADTITLTTKTINGISRNVATRATGGRWKIETKYYTVFFTKQKVTSLTVVEDYYADIARERATQFQAYL